MFRLTIATINVAITLAVFIVKKPCSYYEKVKELHVEDMIKKPSWYMHSYLPFSEEDGFLNSERCVRFYVAKYFADIHLVVFHKEGFVTKNGTVTAERVASLARYLSPSSMDMMIRYAYNPNIEEDACLMPKEDNVEQIYWRLTDEENFNFIVFEPEYAITYSCKNLNKTHSARALMVLIKVGKLMEEFHDVCNTATFPTEITRVFDGIGVDVDWLVKGKSTNCENIFKACDIKLDIFISQSLIRC